MKISVVYLPAFIREFKKLEKQLQDEVVEKVEKFQDSSQHKLLKVHALKGPLRGRYSFSVNFRFRIVLRFNKQKNEAYFLSVGDHRLYE